MSTQIMAAHLHPKTHNIQVARPCCDLPPSLPENIDGTRRCAQWAIRGTLGGSACILVWAGRGSVFPRRRLFNKSANSSDEVRKNKFNSSFSFHHSQICLCCWKSGKSHLHLPYVVCRTHAGKSKPVNSIRSINNTRTVWPSYEGTSKTRLSLIGQYSTRAG